MIDEEAPIADIVAIAALEMGDELEADYDLCKQHVRTFLGIENEEGLHHIVLSSEKDVSSVAARHVLRNAKKVRVVDLVQAMTTLGALALASGEPVRFGIAAANAGIYFLKAFRNAVTVKLDPLDGALVWALVQGGNHLDRPELLRLWQRTVAESGVLDGDTSEAKFDTRLRELEKLGCVFQADGKVSLAEEVQEKQIASRSA